MKYHNLIGGILVLVVVVTSLAVLCSPIEQAGAQPASVTTGPQQRVEKAIPVLISPANGETIPEGQMPTFRWLPPKPTQPGVKYTLRIVEVLGNQLPAEAIKRNAVWFEKKDIQTTTFTYPSSERQFEEGKSYAWSIESGGLRSEIRYIIIPIKSICKFLKVDFVKVSMGDCCCYKISLTNSYKGPSKNQPYSFGVSAGTASIVSSYGLASGWIQSPINVPPATNKLNWKTKGPIPTGKTDLAIICINEGMEPFWLVFEWKNKKGKVICKDSVKIGCKETIPPSCCTFSLVFVNKLNNTNQYSKIKITALGTTKIINADPDDWEQSLNLPNSVEWYLAASNIPTGEAIDNDFMLYLDKSSPSQSLQIEWFDLNGNVVCKHLINVPCRESVSEDEDWTKYTTTTSINDSNLFAFAVQEEDDEDDCGFDENSYKMDSCSFTPSIGCQNNKYKVSVTGPGGFDVFNWEVRDGNSTVVKSFTGENNNFELTTPGSYTISLIAENSNGTCTSTEGITIPSINPDFSWDQENCSRKVNFTGTGSADPDDVKEYTWACNSCSNFPDKGQNVTYDFPNDGSYSITLTIEDIYGCKHTATKTIDISLKCQPDFHVKYVFCPDSCKEGEKKKIEVTFFNDSKGGYCPNNFKWEFGDGATSSDENPKHLYEVNCENGNSFVVILTMKDSQGCTEYLKKTINVKPCKFDFTYVDCPDGRVDFQANAYGTWDFPGATEIAPWPYSGSPENGLYNSRTVRYSSTGDYTVRFTGYNENGCECTVEKTVHVDLGCCTKNDTVKDEYVFIAADGKEYKMRYKFVNRQLPLYHRINGKTILKKHKEIKIKLWKWSITVRYWGGYKADEIEASFNGKIYQRDDAIGCNCKIEVPIDDSKIRPNSKRARFSKPTNGRYRSKLNSLTSTHRVKIGSTVIIKNLQLGTDCDPFRWWTDWY